jgi:hypothetical protein
MDTPRYLKTKLKSRCQLRWRRTPRISDFSMRSVGRILGKTAPSLMYF